MNSLPTVSVVIPVYNQERFIARCLRSALNQTMRSTEYEIILVNDGSTDRTLQAIAPFMDDVHLIDHGEQKGLPAALNTGIRAARGQFMIRIDSDDYVHHEYLNVLTMFLRMNADFNAIACDYLIVDDEEHVIAQKNCLEEPIGCGIMFRLEHLIDIGLYDETFLRREEEELRVRFLQRYEIERCALPFYRYRRHDNNITNDVSEMDAFGEKLADKHDT